MLDNPSASAFGGKRRLACKPMFPSKPVKYGAS